MKHRPLFFFHLQFWVILALLLVSLGLYYYGSQEQHFLEQANAMVLPKEYLAMRAKQEGIDPNLLAKIVDCESKWRMVPNKTSTAFGYFQILDKTEKTTPQYQNGQRKFDPLTNIDMGIYLFKRFGTSPWNESKPCWRFAL